MKALTFGTGVFLRAFFCDFAERAGISVVMSSSTPEGDRRAERINAAGGRFELQYRGILPDGAIVEENRLVAIVEHVYPSSDQATVLALASDPAYSLIVSNVSEAGFRHASPPAIDTFATPVSFPARLTRWLYERWQTLGPTASVTVLPCELFTENGQRLRAMLREVVASWQMPPSFSEYLENTVVIADTLVDRIVPGETLPSTVDADYPALICEPFALWAIRGTDALAARLESLLIAASEQVYVSDSIDAAVLKKVRFLNGLHTAMAALGPEQYGVTTVRQAVEHPELGPFLRALLMEEILPANAPPLDFEEARLYAETTWARMRNPFLEHRLADINKGRDAKWPVRLRPTVAAYNERFGSPPPRLSRCMALFAPQEP